MIAHYFHCVLCNQAFVGGGLAAHKHMRREHFAVPMTIDIWPALITKRQALKLRIPIGESL